MYINSGIEITNTPSNLTAAYNTSVYAGPQSSWQQPVSTYYTDALGNVRRTSDWNPVPMVRVPGGMYKGTPTRTAAFYVHNVVPATTFL